MATRRWPFSYFLAERGGFEPPVGYEPIHAFQACDLNHSSISPDGFTSQLLAKPPIITRILGSTRVSCYLHRFCPSSPRPQHMPHRIHLRPHLLRTDQPAPLQVSQR